MNEPYINLRDKKEFQAIDILKLGCAFTVVSAHIPILGTSEYSFIYWINFLFANYLARISVPFFFMTAGFFLFKKTSLKAIKKNIIKKYIYRVFLMYVLWSIIYLPLSLREILIGTDNIRSIITTYLFSFIFTGSYIQLWYLPALLIAVIMIDFLNSIGCKTSHMFCIGCLLYFIGLFGDSWYGFIRLFISSSSAFYKWPDLFLKCIGTTRNGFFEGFLYVLLGAICANKKFMYSKKYAAIIGMISAVFMLIEVVILRKYNIPKAYNMMLFTVPTVFFLFLFVSSIDLGKSEMLCRFCRFSSSVMYFSHLWIEVILIKGFQSLGITIFGTCIDYFVTVAACMFFSFLLFKYSTRYKKSLMISKLF